MDDIKKEMHFLYRIIAPLIVGLLTAAVLGIFGMAISIAQLNTRLDAAIERLEKNEGMDRTVTANTQRLTDVERRLNRLEGQK